MLTFDRSMMEWLGDPVSEKDVGEEPEKAQLLAKV